MSGDAGLHDESIIFYSKKMTKAKLVLLAHKGIKLNWKEYEYQTLPSKEIVS